VKTAPRVCLRMGRENERVKCSQKTVKGVPCQGHALAGSDRCASHAGRVGARPKLTPELADQIVALLGRGVPLGVAAAALGVCRASLYRWLSRPEPEFRAFAERVQQARAKGGLALVAAVLRQSETRWQSAAWILEREYPDRYGRPGDRPASRPESPGAST
jgi:hypothetical protein